MSTKVELSFIKAMLPVITMIILIMLAVIVWEIPIHLAIFFELIITVSLALYWGYHWEDIEKMLFSNFRDIGNIIMILLLIGMLIGVWIASGTVPTMIYFGLKLINPKYFLLLSFVLTSAISMAIGTAVGTASTIGLALISIASSLGFPLPLVAGAIISGSYVGDRMSPVSSIANITAYSAGVKIDQMVKHMIYSIIPPWIISSLLYLILGLKYLPATIELKQIQVLTSIIAANFNISIWLLIPPLLIIILSALKMPTLANLTISILTSLTLGLIFNSTAANSLMISMFSGFDSITGNPVIDNLLSRGGLTSMLELIALIMLVVLLGGLFEELGILSKIIERLVNTIQRKSQLILVTMISSIINAMLGCNQLFSVLLTGKMMQKKFDQMEIPRKELGRALGDSGLILSPLIPWNVNALMMVGILGVGTLEYMPYTFLPLLLPLSGALFGMKDIRSFNNEAC